MPANVAGKIKVVGVLDGWPFPVKEEPTEVDVKLTISNRVSESPRGVQKALAR